jgi:hypothetical protein
MTATVLMIVTMELLKMKESAVCENWSTKRSILTDCILSSGSMIPERFVWSSMHLVEET